MDPYGRYPGYGYGAGYPVGGSQFQEVREEIRDEIVQTNNGYGPFGGGSQFVEERVIEKDYIYENQRGGYGGGYGGYY